MSYHSKRDAKFQKETGNPKAYPIVDVEQRYSPGPVAKAGKEGSVDPVQEKPLREREISETENEHEQFVSDEVEITPKSFKS